METELEPSKGAASASNHWTINQAPGGKINRKDKLQAQEDGTRVQDQEFP